MRWKATLVYRTDNGPVDVEHEFEEIEDLHDLVERGPDWNTLVKITIVLARVSTPSLTVEQASNR